MCRSASLRAATQPTGKGAVANQGILPSRQAPPTSVYSATALLQCYSTTVLLQYYCSATVLQYSPGGQEASTPLTRVPVPWNTQISPVGLPAAASAARLASKRSWALSLTHTSTSLTATCTARPRVPRLGLGPDLPAPSIEWNWAAALGGGSMLAAVCWPQ